MKKATRRIAALLSVSALLSLTACGGPIEQTPSTSPSASTPTESQTAEVLSTEPSYGGSVTLYYNSDINAYYDPAINDTACYALWLESLFAYDVTTPTDEFQIQGDYIPSSCLTGQIADTWSWDEEAATITVNLRQDVYFQDKEPYNGRQLVASDVKWSYDRILGIGSGYDEPLECEADWASRLTMIESIECPDDFTVVFHLSTNTEVAYETFQTTFLKIGGPEWDTLTAEQQSSLEYASGTGPYIVTELVAGSSVTLVKNENYYDTDDRYPENKLPYLDEINFVYIADSTNIVSQFTSGTLDWFGYRANLINDSEAAQIAASGVSYIKQDYSVSQPESIALRCNTEPFNDIRVRQALQYAIDLETLNTSYFGNEVSAVIPALWNPTLTDWCTIGTWSDELLEQYTYNPEKAKQLLEDAGYGDGFEFTVVISPDNDVDLFTYVNSTYFAPLGITMNLETVSNFFEAKTIGNDEHDTRSSASTGVAATSSLTAAQNQTLDGGWASALWNGDAEYASLLDSLANATTLADQNQYAQEADLYYAEQHWAVHLSGLKTVSEFFSTRLQGYGEGNRLYSGKTFGTVVSHMWVSE